MGTAEKPLCRRVAAWLKGRSLSTAPLTGQDSRALSAFVHVVDLYGCSDGEGRRQAVVAMRAAVLAMQRSTWHLAKACIPMVLDWSDEEQIWSLLCLDDDAPPLPSVRCGADLGNGHCANKWPCRLHGAAP